jgi:HEPN domain-containing protein
MEFLKKKALRFYSKAIESFEKEEFDFAMLFLEQAIQLGLKFVISRKYGEIPKTHSFKLLFELAEMKDFYIENADTLREIELAYTASRYFDVEYSKNTVERCLKLAKKFLDSI